MNTDELMNKDVYNKHQQQLSIFSLGSNKLVTNMVMSEISQINYVICLYM